jgi:hypothetical protein
VRYGGLENLGEKLMKTENFELALDEIVWLLTLLANQSILIYNLKHRDAPHDLLTEEEVELLTSPFELAEYKSATQAEKAEVAMQMFFDNTQQYAGNFARESTQTISGSLGLLQAAVGSFTAGLGNSSADMTNLTGNLVDAFGAVVQNIVPVLQNIVTAIPEAAGAILQAVGELLPMLIETVTSLFTQMLQTMLSLLPQLIPAAVEALMTIVGALIDNLPLLISAAIQLVTALVQGIGDALLEAALQLISNGVKRKGAATA